MANGQARTLSTDNTTLRIYSNKARHVLPQSLVHSRRSAGYHNSTYIQVIVVSIETVEQLIITMHYKEMKFENTACTTTITCSFKPYQQVYHNSTYIQAIVVPIETVEQLIITINYNEMKLKARHVLPQSLAHSSLTNRFTTIRHRFIPL